MRGHRPFVLAAMLALLLGGRGQALAQQGGAALRDSLAHATDVLAYHPDSVDLRLKRLHGTYSWSNGTMPRMSSTRCSSSIRPTLRDFSTGLLSTRN